MSEFVVRLRPSGLNFLISAIFQARADTLLHLRQLTGSVVEA
jgi:hypothetical protein